MQFILSDPIKIITALIALFGLAFTWRKFREDSLRRGEVLAWADDCIMTFENLIVGAILFDQPVFKEESRKRIIDAAFEAPALIERGRIFFKNQPFRSFGQEKPPAYRGLRPKILDPLVAAHQIAVRFIDSDEEARIRLQLVAEDYLKAFVSLVQTEIGRERTAAAETPRAPGRGPGTGGARTDFVCKKCLPPRPAFVRLAARWFLPPGSPCRAP